MEFLIEGKGLGVGDFWVRNALNRSFGSRHLCQRAKALQITRCKDSLYFSVRFGFKFRVRCRAAAVLLSADATGTSSSSPGKHSTRKNDQSHSK